MLPRTLALIASLSLLAGAALLPACESPESKLAGTYELDKETTRESMQERIDIMEDEQDIAEAQMLMQALDQFNWTITLNEDMTVTGNSVIMGQTETFRGTWSLDADDIAIRFTEPEEQPELVNGVIHSEDTILLMPAINPRMDMTLVMRKQSDQS